MEVQSDIILKKKERKIETFSTEPRLQFLRTKCVNWNKSIIPLLSMNLRILSGFSLEEI